MTELTVLAPDHPWLLSIIAGACAMAGANIVDAQIYTTTDGRALDTISLTREFERDEDEERRANRIADSIEKALRGELRLPDVVAKRAPPKGRIRAFALEPTVTINNQWSHRYTMVEITGLDRTGLLYELTATLSKLNLNIASRPRRHLRRARGRRVLRHRPDGRADHLADAAGGHQARADRAVRQGRKRGQGGEKRGGGDDGQIVPKAQPATLAAPRAPACARRSSG